MIDHAAVIEKRDIWTERRDDRHHKAFIAVAERDQIAETCDIEILAVAGEAIATKVLQNVVEQNGAEQPLTFRRAVVHGLDVAVDVAFFVGQEEIDITVTADECFTF